MKKAPTYDKFSKEYEKMNVLSEFEKYAEQEGVSRNAIKKEWVNIMVSDYLKKEMSDSTARSYESYSDYAESLISDDKMLKEIMQKAVRLRLNLRDRQSRPLRKMVTVHLL